MLSLSVYYEDEDASIKLGKFIKEIININEKVIIVCIGTDKYICDCLGPLVGSLLVDSKIPLNVYGVLNNPIHSINFEETTKEIINLYPDYKIIAIDGYLGNEEEIGYIHFGEGGINPGAAVYKKHSPIGDYAIKAVIQNVEVSDYLLKLPIRLRYIFKIATIIRDAFKYAYEI
ncbi:putative sporulation protein YyaC [Clostridium cavendishii DSM 21758]|uniref:Putative sporulation protein YyaC n=1 Tax=Clostridium cavendishii DSM 21758 TaxID=1121302 RepID=A0A1M6HPU4_9CLOT|nr:spore protease YyaC [Clostridium cavendishii]SHJ24208.1 putative sporulation protein YyaC [Clostridium cavendishii DSM 21758]